MRLQRAGERPGRCSSSPRSCTGPPRSAAGGPGRRPRAAPSRPPAGALPGSMASTRRARAPVSSISAKRDDGGWYRPPPHPRGRGSAQSQSHVPTAEDRDSLLFQIGISRPGYCSGRSRGTGVRIRCVRPQMTYSSYPKPESGAVLPGPARAGTRSGGRVEQVARPAPRARGRPRGSPCGGRRAPSEDPGGDGDARSPRDGLTSSSLPISERRSSGRRPPPGTLADRGVQASRSPGSPGRRGAPCARTTGRRPAPRGE
jgi:hypothetical protein